MSFWHLLSFVNSFFKRMCSHPVGLDVWFLVGPFILCANSEGSGKTAGMRRLAWAFAGHLRDKYHHLMSWLILDIMLLPRCEPMAFCTKKGHPPDGAVSADVIMSNPAQFCQILIP